MDDWQLLKSYGCDGSQDAFTEIVRRHLNLVYCAALRQVRQPELARDVTQLVFSNLARRAKSLKPRGTVAGWLFRDAHFTSLDTLRRERRRFVREQNAVAMQEAETSPDWRRIQTGLDAALSQLGQTDRDAVLLRFFEQRSLKDVGSVLGIDEDAARKRIGRALEKLRLVLAKRGITTTGEALSGALTAHAVQVAPAGLTVGILATSLAAGSAATGTGASTLMEFLTMTTKFKTTVAATALLAAVGTPMFLQHAENKSLRSRNETLLMQNSQFDALVAENEQLSNRVAQMANNAPTAEQQVEINRLRGEVARLRATANEAERLRAEIGRLRSAGGVEQALVDPTTEALAAYLGQAVPPPAGMNPAYSEQGLIGAVQQAAQLAGVRVKKLEIETSEFPYLVGVVCESEADLRKLTSQFKNMPDYEYGGGTSSHEACAFSIVPYRAFQQDGDRIRRRSILRIAKFFDQLSGRSGN